jgi:transcriptional regulator with XRE-family HTH domain
MGRHGGPPLNGPAILRARLYRGLTQQEVAEQCATLGVDIDRSALSLIENSRVRHPHPKIPPVLAQVLGLQPAQMYKTDGEPDDEEEDEAAALAK